jgi:hypothetical protein
MRQRRPFGGSGRGRDPVHHRGLYAQIIGGLIVAVPLAAVPLVWTKLIEDSPERLRPRPSGSSPPGLR